MRRYPMYETRQHPDRGYYVVADTGQLAHETMEDGTLRAAFFPTEAEAEACAEKLNGTMA